jgi:hypothetical protein
MPAAARTPEEIRASVEATREELRYSLVDLQGKVNELSDWRASLRRNRRAVVIGAVAAGFLVGGGVAAAIGLFRRSRGADAPQTR